MTHPEGVAWMPDLAPATGAETRLIRTLVVVVAVGVAVVIAMLVALLVVVNALGDRVDDITNVAAVQPAPSSDTSTADLCSFV
jgi:Na+-transporting methylmalonyl-CoA/oxaloacetate decarboxylase gamma subunit